MLFDYCFYRTTMSTCSTLGRSPKEWIHWEQSMLEKEKFVVSLVHDYPYDQPPIRWSKNKIIVFVGSPMFIWSHVAFILFFTSILAARKEGKRIRRILLLEGQGEEAHSLLRKLVPLRTSLHLFPGGASVPCICFISWISPWPFFSALS